MTSTDSVRPQAGPTAGDQAAVAAIPRRIIEAWSRHDAEAFADVFTEDGSMILPGVFRKGRAEIRAFMAAAFKGPFKGTQVTGSPVDVRFLDPTTAVLITRGGIRPPGAAEVPAGRGVVASWVAVREESGWRLAGYQNSPADAPVTEEPDRENGSAR